MLNNEEKEAEEKMQDLANILSEWEEASVKKSGIEEHVHYKIPILKQTLGDLGKCRIYLDFKCVSDAEKFLLEMPEPVALYTPDSLVEADVPNNRKFVVRRPGGMPTAQRLQKIIITTQPVATT